jgi:hypothetical protein
LFIGPPSLAKARADPPKLHVFPTSFHSRHAARFSIGFTAIRSPVALSSARDLSNTALRLRDRRGDRTRRALFDKLVSLCNDVGLLTEEYDPAARQFLGNFPQAFSRVALINTAR